MSASDLPASSPALSDSPTNPLIWRLAFVAGAVAVPFAGALPSKALAMARDPHPGWLAVLKDADAHWLAASREPDAGDLDTPECLHWDAEKDRLRQLIGNRLATAPAGIAAQIEFIAQECHDGRLDADQGEAAHDVPLPFLERIRAAVEAL